MSLIDLTANNLTMIRNAVRVGKPQVDVPASKMTRAVLQIMKTEGYIKNFKPMEGLGKQGLFRIYLKYDKDSRSVIRNLRRISRSGRRVYVTNRKIPRVLRGLGTAILSTSKGVLSDKEARRLNVGGEVVCYIW